VLRKLLSSILIILLLIFLPSNTLGKQIYKDIKVNKILSVYDGDTFRVNINSFPNLIGNNISIRVFGVDTPEKRGAKCSYEKEMSLVAMHFTYNFLKQCKESIILKKVQRGKYFRIVAEPYCGKVSLTKELIKNNLAIEYYGGKKVKTWCD